jgi:hypothetical protein
MKKITGVVVTAFVFLLGLLGVASAEEIPGRSSESQLKHTDLEMNQARSKHQNLEAKSSRLKVQNLEKRQGRWKGEDLEAEKSGQVDQAEAMDMFGRRDGTKKS